MKIDKIIVQARRRLRADAKTTFLQFVDRITTKYGLAKQRSFYPKEYSAVTDAQTVKNVKEEFEALVFTFKKFAAHSPNAIAIEAIGIYRSIEYIIDIVFHGTDLKVEVYY